jgi:hypothetical protein
MVMEDGQEEMYLLMGDGGTKRSQGDLRYYGGGKGGGVNEQQA